MKRIQKRKEPSRLREWKRNNSQFADANYDAYGFPVAEVNAALVVEQGGLCAYTMIRITTATSHNEHLKPRSVSKAEVPPNYAETVDYNNLVACYPDTSAADKQCPFGADFRGKRWDAQRMITPLMGICETAFEFDQSGEVRPSTPGDHAADWTIEALNLNHRDLISLRKQAYLEHGLSPVHPKPLTATAARTLAADVCNQKKDANFKPFCIAIKQVAIQYADRLEKQKLRRHYAAQAK